MPGEAEEAEEAEEAGEFGVSCLVCTQTRGQELDPWLYTACCDFHLSGAGTKHANSYLSVAMLSISSVRKQISLKAVSHQSPGSNEQYAWTGCEIYRFQQILPSKEKKFYNQHKA